MIIVTKHDTTEDQIDHIREHVEALGLRTHVSRGAERTVVGCVGDEDRLRNVPLLRLPGVESVHPVVKPYKLASREFSPQSSTVELGDAALGGPEFVVMAGPCSVEGREMIQETAAAVKRLGGRALRGGAYKPRTSPYSFRGLGAEALELLAEARQATGLPVISEVMDPRQIDEVAGHADVLQIGARNMQNFDLLSEVGRTSRPVLLKRGLSSTIKDLLLAAEYVMSQGNPSVILCERGIRTFETHTRNTFDVSAIPVLKAESHLPVVADPSHAGGRRELVAPLARASVAAGADGVLVETHPRPEEALSDGDQSLDLEEFQELMTGLRPFVEAAGRRLHEDVADEAAA